MCLNNRSIFLLCPSLFLYIRIQMIMPTFSALLPNSSRKMLCNICPIFSAMLHNKTHNKFILLFSLYKIIYTQGPLISFGFSTFCHLWRHWTSVLSWKKLAILFQFLAPNSSTNRFNWSSSYCVHHLFLTLNLSKAAPILAILLAL